MTNTIFFKITYLLLFSFFSLIILQSCNSDQVEKEKYESEKKLIERLQLDCNKEYKKSEMGYETINEIQHDPANEPLAELAAKHIVIADTLDISFREIISLIEEIKWILLIQKNNISSENRNSQLIISYENYYPLRPSIIDLKDYDFVSLDSRPNTFNVSIKSLSKRIESLREAVTKLTLEYYNIKNSESLEINQKEDFKSYLEEFNSMELAIKRSNEYLCGSGELRRIEQINLELLFNNDYWEASYSAETPSPIIFCHLINLQNNLLYTRNMIFELMSLNLHCEYMKMKNK